MTIEPNRIPFAEFSENLAELFARVLDTGEALVVETDSGETVTVSSATPAIPQPKTEADYAAFRSAAGSWADVDVEAFLADIYESRESSRSPVHL
ncbi:MAG: hypothetical protein HC802_00305 [Caldilineaceae bacterium]|nr:hypothetical protein [Caldilineaceae bacterium]